MDKILIADDDSIFLKLLISALEEYKEKFEIIGVHNGQEAINVLSETKISLLITDIKMPKVDGLSLLAYMNEHFPAIPCFVMTAYETPGLKAKLPKDLLRFLTKPFPANKLGAAILEALKEKTPRGALQGISVVSFLQMIELEKKTCIFEVTLPDKRGLFYFEQGVPCNAACGNLKGEEAALELITRERGIFQFKPFPKQKLIKRKNLVLKDLIEKALNKEDKSDQTLEIKAEKPVENAIVEAVDSEAVPVQEKNVEKDEPEKKEVVKEAARPQIDLNLPGEVIYNYGRNRGDLDVINMSIEGMLFRLRYRQKFSVGDKVSLEFNLDDAPRSLVTKDAVIRAIDDFYVKAEFTDKKHYDKLGPYLHFNKLEAQKIF